MKKGSKQKPESIEMMKKTLSSIFSGAGNPFAGKKHSEESLAKMRANRAGKPAHNKGKPMSEEQKAKLRAAALGRKHSEETKLKMSASHMGHEGFWLGKHMSETQKQKSREKQSGENNHFFGKKHSEETLKIMSENRVGLTAKENNPAWKGGTMPINHTIRSDKRYKNWQHEVWKQYGGRDAFTGEKLNSETGHVHHKKEFHTILKENNVAPDAEVDKVFAIQAITDVNNGILLSKENHYALHTVKRILKKQKLDEDDLFQP